VNLTAARDIKGQFMLRNGAGGVHAGRDAGSDTSPISLGLTAGGWNVSALQDIFINEVYNPNGSQNNGRVGGIAYRFDYAVSAQRPDPVVDDVMYAVRFLYSPSPGQIPSGPSPAQQVETDLARARAARPRNIDYWYCGSPTVKPITASDDGVHTRLTFGAKAELPAIFVRNDDGSESLLNFSMDAGDVVIHRVAPKFIVRRGRLTGCIVNRGFVGSGERLESGTVAPDVLRERKDARP